MRGVYVVKRNDPDYRLYNTCFRWADACGWPWVKVRHRRKYSTVTVDMISAAPPRELDAATFEKCLSIIRRYGKPGSHVVGGPACFYADGIPIRCAGNVADLLLAIARLRGGS